MINICRRLEVSFVMMFMLSEAAPHCAAVEANGVLSLIDVVDVSSESMGTLVELSVQEGDQVSRGDTLGRVDDRQATVDNEIAQVELDIQQAQVENSSRLLAAEGRAKVAQAEYEESVAINANVSRAIPQLRVRRLMLTSEQAQLEVEVARLERRINQLNLASKAAGLRRAELELSRFHIQAPLDGIVVERFKHPGEWVLPGDPLLKICRLDRLRVEWLLDVSLLPPHKAKGLPVAAEIEVGVDDKVRVEGDVDFVSPIVEPTGECRLWFEFDNPLDSQGNWLLRAGQEARILFLEDQNSADVVERDE